VYAISFDMEVAKLKENYGEPYNPAYDEIRKTMRDLEFDFGKPHNLLLLDFHCLTNKLSI